ncbi:hypothetical protein QQ045_008648 [Rhodiola kirilowii]
MAYKVNKTMALFLMVAVLVGFAAVAMAGKVDPVCYEDCYNLCIPLPTSSPEICKEQCEPLCDSLVREIYGNFNLNLNH